MTARHPHAAAGLVALFLLTCVVLGPGVLDALRDRGTDGRWLLAADTVEVDGDTLRLSSGDQTLEFARTQ